MHSQQPVISPLSLTAQYAYVMAPHVVFINLIPFWYIIYTDLLCASSLCRTLMSHRYMFCCFSQGDDNLQNRLALLTCGCLPRFFHLACKGTNVTRELMLEVVEVSHNHTLVLFHCIFSCFGQLHVLSHYRRERDDSRRTISRQAPPPEEDFHRHHKSSYYRSENKSNDPTSEKALEGLDEIARSCFLVSNWH